MNRVVLMALLLAVVAAPAAAQPAPEPRVIRIVIRENSFTPATVTLKAGEPILLELQNLGVGRHQFRSRIFRGIDVWIRTPAFDARSERFEVIILRPGVIARLEFRRRTAGEYEFWCAQREGGRTHRELGEVGKFIVTP